MTNKCYVYKNITEIKVAFMLNSLYIVFYNMLSIQQRSALNINITYIYSKTKSCQQLMA